MPTFDRDLASTVLVGEELHRVHDKSLFNYLTTEEELHRVHDKNLFNTVGFDQGSEAFQQADLTNQLIVSQIICVDGDFSGSISNNLQIGNYLAGRVNSLHDGRNWPDQGIDPQPVINFFGTWNKRTYSNVRITYELVGFGGLIWDYSCAPIQLVPNYEPMNWGEFDEENWNNFGDGEWENFGD